MQDSSFADFLTRSGLQWIDRLGDGKDGVVIQTNRPSAAKKLFSAELYHRELRMYPRLSDLGIHQFGIFATPRLLSADDATRIIEMTIVSPPFVLDFAASYTNAELEHLGFSEEVWNERNSHWSDVFQDDWPAVRDVRDEIAARTGLTILDLTRNNIRSC